MSCLKKKVDNAIRILKFAEEEAKTKEQTKIKVNTYGGGI